MEMGEDEIRWHKPIAYQEKNGTRQLAATHYAVKDKNRVAFEMAGYDVHRPLYIDPLIYSTYLGGNGKTEVQASPWTARATLSYRGNQLEQLSY